MWYLKKEWPDPLQSMYSNLSKMSVVGSAAGLLCICVVLHRLGSTRADRVTNGFPNVLVPEILDVCDMNTNHTLRLIPEMTFTCNGTIVGFTVAGRQWTEGSVDPIVQIWRQNSSQNIYYRTSVDEIVVNKETCGETSTVSQGSSDNDQVWYCNLNATNRVPVQAGDILGLLLPPRNDSSFQLSFARVSRGPTNYVFEDQEVQAVDLCNKTGTKLNQEQPQIAVQVEPESNCAMCVRGFPDMPVFEVGGHARSDTVITSLIPHMNFTYNATIVGFLVAGRGLSREPYSKIQVWRQNSSQVGVYYKVEPDINIVNIDIVCVSSIRVVANVRSCILNDEYQVSVQPGDILGLELPQTNQDEFFFVSGGPKNYIFEHEMTSPIKLNDSNYMRVQQPQIAFNLTSGQCTNGFPIASRRQNTEQMIISAVTTYLFPSLTFGCNGTIVRLTVTVTDSNGLQGPKVQIWREKKGLHYKLSPEILISDLSCEDLRLSEGRFQCTLNEAARVSVQPGDILGLNIPPDENRDGYGILFTTSTESNAYIFQHQLSSTVNLTEANVAITSYLPRITPLVILDENAGPCSGKTSSEVPAVCPSPMITTTASSTSAQPSGTGLSEGEKVGITALVIIVILLAVITILVAVFVVQRKSWKKQTRAANSDVPDEIADRPVPEYDEIIDQERVHSKANSPAKVQAVSNRYCSTGSESQENNHDCTIVQNEALQICLDNQNYVCGTYAQDAESLSPGTKEDDGRYWEPAATVNELYRQLSSKKYREISQQQVEIKYALGSGQFGEVSKGIWQSPMGAMDVAVKQLQPGASEEEKVKFLQEAAINGQFRHPNVVQLMGVVTVGEPTMIVLELMSNGDLRNFLVKHQPQAEKQKQAGVDKHVLLRFCQHIASGMSYLSLKAFVHRDLAARNILVSGDRICKISDFGMSRNLMDENYYVSHGGKIPVKWTAPEAIHYKKYSTASDVWSFGCVMYEIWSLGHKPFENHTNPEAVKLVDKGYRLPPPPGLSKELYKIMIQCWQPESNQRPTFPQLVEMLSRADFELFVWEEEDLRNSDPQVKLIGAPLEVTKDLYHQLQRVYLSY